jgi:multisubunit Na+/H+ antiporter MnhE subunit
MSQFISWIIAIVTFIGWMSLVGSPSTTETIIGLVIAAVAGFMIF